MPLSKQWASVSRSERFPNQVGVYELAYNKNLINIGSGTIAERLAAKNFNFTHYRYTITNSRTRARQIERRELKNYGSRERELPKYNSEIPDPPR